MDLGCKVMGGPAVPSSCLSSWSCAKRAGRRQDRDGTVARIPLGQFPTVPSMALKEALPRAQFVDAADLIWELRMIKSVAEVELIRSAARITAQALHETLPQVEAGMTERQVANMVAVRLLQHGADKFNYVSAIAGEGTYEQFCRLPTDRAGERGRAGLVRSLSDLSRLLFGYVFLCRGRRSN